MLMLLSVENCNGEGAATDVVTSLAFYPRLSVVYRLILRACATISQSIIPPRLAFILQQLHDHTLKKDLYVQMKKL